MRTSTIIATLGLFALAACDKPKADETAHAQASASQAAVAPTVSAAPTPVAMTSAEIAAIPTQEDYEAAAEKSVTKANASAVLDALEKDLAAH